MSLGAAVDLAPLWVIGGYLALLLGIGSLAGRRAASSSDYFVAGRSVGPFLLLMSVFGTTMTAFSMVGSTAKAFDQGIGVYGLMASASGLVHSLVLVAVGIPLWAIGKRHGFVTQIQYFRSRFESRALGYVLFPVLVGLVIPYVLVGLIGAGAVVRGVTAGMFDGVFPGELDAATGQAAFAGAVPPWLTGLCVCGVVLVYVLAGGVRAVAVANACQTILFMAVGVLAFWLIARSLGGVEAASRTVAERRPELLSSAGMVGRLEAATYCLVPLSMAMFPHLFQHWLTARSAKAFRTTIIAHPIFIMIVWLPCVLIGVWGAGIAIEPPGGNANAVLAKMVGSQIGQPLVSGLLAAGILAAIMSSLDSQLLCLGTMFTHDVAVDLAGPDRFTDRQRVALGRGFIVLIAGVAYALSLFPTPHLFDLAVWSFSGFASLFPLVLASLYWRRATRAGAIAAVVVAAATWAALFYQGMIAPTAESRGGGEYLIAGMMPVALMLAASTLALVAVSLLSRPPDRSTLERFFPVPTERR